MIVSGKKRFKVRCLSRSGEILLFCCFITTERNKKQEKNYFSKRRVLICYFTAECDKELFNEWFRMFLHLLFVWSFLLSAPAILTSLVIDDRQTTFCVNENPLNHQTSPGTFFFIAQSRSRAKKWLICYSYLVAAELCLISPPTIIHIKFDSVKRQITTCFLADLNLIRERERRRRANERANGSKCLFIAERHNSALRTERTARKGHSVINKLRFGDEI